MDIKGNTGKSWWPLDQTNWMMLFIKTSVASWKFNQEDYLHAISIFFLSLSPSLYFLLFFPLLSLHFLAFNSISWLRAFTISVKPIRFCHSLSELIILLKILYLLLSAVISVSHRYNPSPPHSPLPLSPTAVMRSITSIHIFSQCSSTTHPHH